jgi:hypothetical protein
MANDKEYIVEALLKYLGGSPTAPGIETGGAEERLVSAGLAAMKKSCESVLDELMSDDQSWRSKDLEKVASLAADRMQRLHAEFPPLLLQKLGNWYAYQWR